MTNESKKQVLMLGLPESGKTSFLSALYHYVSSLKEDKTYEEYKQSNDTTYLNKIVENWLCCKKPYRTASLTGISNKEVKLHLIKTATQEKLDLCIPDIAGESFIQQFTNRIWDFHYKQQVENATGILLFINPNFVKPHVLIDDLTPIINLLNEVDLEPPITASNENLTQSLSSSEEITSPETHENLLQFTANFSPNAAVNNESGENLTHLSNQESQNKSGVAFKLEETPTQVVLIDILENHKEIMPLKKVIIALTISAWDEIMESGNELTPQKWLQVHLPLLYQFLISNFETFSFEVFGISAQGGNFKNPEQKKKLQDYLEPSDRIIVQERDNEHKNICAPIDWIIEQWQKTIL